jgi:hypothetical protein
MPAGQILACEPDGPLGTDGPRRAIVLLGPGAAREKEQYAPHVGVCARTENNWDL